MAQNVHVLNGQTYTVTVNPTVINSLNIDPGGTVDLTNKNLIVNDSGVDTTYSGTITGAINNSALIKAGTGTVTFSSLTSNGGELHINGGKAIQAGTVNNIRYLAVGSDGGNASFDISGGTLNILGTTVPVFPAFQVGDFGGIGVVNQTGGLVHFDPSAFNIGNQGGNGTYNISGGSIFFGPGGGFTIGRSNNSTRNSTGLLNVSGGVVEVQGSDFVIGNNNPGGGALTEGTLTQTGGTVRVGAAANLYLQGYNKGTYNLNGGTLEIGGASLHGEKYVGFGANATGSYQFNLGGGTVKVIGSALTTNADANLVGGTTSIIDTNGLGATWNGVLSGGGFLTKTGAGTLTLSAIDTYTGGTTVAEGTLALSAGGSIAQSAGVNLVGGGNAIFDITLGSKTIKDLSGVGGTIVNLGASTLTAGTGNNTSFRGIIQGAGGGLTKVGGGVLTLGGPSTYTGATNINNGTLKMGIGDAFAASTTVNVANNARWDLGGMGTQHVAGPVTFNAGIESIDLGAGDNVLATGVVTGNSGKVDVHGGDGSFDPNADYIFLQGSGAAGSFVVVGNDMPLLTPTAVLDGNHFELHFAKSGQTMAFLSQTKNQGAVGGALDNLLLNNPLYAQIATLGLPAILETLDKLSGDFHASTKSELIQTAQYLPEAVGDRFDQALGGAPPAAPMAYAEDDKTKWPTAKSGGPRAWVQGYGHIIQLGDATGNAGKLNATHGGVLGGVDAGNGDWLVGIGGGYSVSSLNSDSRSATGNVQSFHALAYGGGQAGPVEVRVGGAYSLNTIGTTRSVLMQTLTANYRARTMQAFGEVGAEMGSFTPFAGANYINVATDAFSETGGMAALSAAASSQSIVFTTLGARAQADAGNGVVLHGMAGWRHAFGDVTPLDSLTIQGQGYTVAGVPVAADAFVAEAGVDMKVGNGATLGVSYSGQIGPNAQDHGAKGTAAVNF